jgi:hypothetical protein
MTSANILARVRSLLDESNNAGTGGILSVAVRGAGTGYSVGDRLTLSGGGANAIVEVMTLSGSAVASVAILVAGTGYVSATGVATTASPSSGRSGCTIDILAVSEATYFTNTEIYQALTDGQNSLCSIAVAAYKSRKNSVGLDIEVPYILQPLYTTLSGTVTSGTNTITLTNPIFELLSLAYNSNSSTPLYPVRFRNVSGANIFQQANDFLPNMGTYYYAKFYSNKVIALETASTNNASAYMAEIIGQPVDIDASNNPSLPDVAMSVIAQFAFSQLLSKEKRLEEAKNAFGAFIKLSQPLVS